MNFDNIIHYINSLDGNYRSRKTDVYYPLINLYKLIKIIENYNKIIDILITPYLINETYGLISELHYYEFELEVVEGIQSKYIEFPVRNLLPNEIINNIKPKAIVEKSDIKFFINALSRYISVMNNMKFEEEKNYNDRLLNAKLYFQIF